MDQSLRALLRLVRCALLCEQEALPEDISMEQICKLATEHQIQAMVYDGAVRCGISKQDPSMKSLFQHYGHSMIKSELQMANLQALYKAFDEEKIDYLPLKGCIMKPLYPKAELRAMNDADILIKTEQYDKIKPVLQRLSYQFEAESDCELKWITKGLYLELHKRLIPSFIKDFYAYFGDGWQLAVPESGTRYAMSEEDTFLFIFTHFARHYREGGVGIRHMADIWYYRKQFDLDEEKVADVLEQMSLRTFYDNILKTLDNWFENGEETPITQKITDYIVSSGSLGQSENKVVAEAVRKGGKGSRMMRLLFPSVGDMRYAYPVLQKCPVLLPGVWVYRGIKIVFFRRDKLKMQQNRSKMIENEKVRQFEENMRAVGINTDFEEH